VARFDRRQRRRRAAWALGLAVAVVVTVLAVVVVVPGAPGSPAPPFVGHRTRLASRPAVTPASPASHPAATYPTARGVGAAWVVAENQRPGTGAWQITGAQTATGIMGYADHVDATSGQVVTLRVSTTAPSFHVEAYRMGYYQALGARLVWRSAQLPGAVQAACPVAPGINMVQCSWLAALRLTVTDRWVQGQYLLKLVGSAGQQSYVPLDVWDPASHAAYVVMTGVLTDQVFNSFGGYDLYQGATACAADEYPCSTRSRVVSFDRPYDNGEESGAGGYLSLCYPLTRLAERDGLDVTYWSDITLAEHGNLAVRHHLLISPGHDEEWSQSMRASTVAAAHAGVNLAFLGASAVLRKVRLRASPLGPDRQVVNYRDPTADPLYGVDDTRVSQNDWAQAPAHMPASTLVGASYIGYDHTSVKPLVVSNASSWLFAGTSLVDGSTVPGVVAGDIQAYARSARGNPPGVEILAHSPVDIVGHPDRRFADTTYYTMASSGAGVFDTGAIGWIPSLAPCPASTTACPALVMGALTANLLRITGSGPAGLRYPSVANWQQLYR